MALAIAVCWIAETNSSDLVQKIVATARK